MYNIHQYNNAVRAQEESRLSEERYAKYLLRHGGTPTAIQISRKGPA